MMGMTMGDDETIDAAATEYVTVVVDGQHFGLPVARVQDVFRPLAMTQVPLAPREIAGILNLRGRIVTMIDMTARLGRARHPAMQMAVTVDLHGESYGLMVDSVRDVVRLPDSELQAVPINFDAALARLASSAFWLDAGLLVILDIDRVLDLPADAIAA